MQSFKKKKLKTLQDLMLDRDFLELTPWYVHNRKTEQTDFIKIKVFCSVKC